MSIGTCIYLWAFYFVPLIYISVFVPVPYCLDDCGFVVELEVKQLDSFSFILLSQDCFDPAILLLGTDTKETRSERHTCTPMFIAALFIIAMIWKQPRCPSADGWIRKLWYIYTMEYYSVIKKNSFESVLMRWMKLEPIIQNEIRQKDKDQYSILTHIYVI